MLVFFLLFYIFLLPKPSIVGRPVTGAFLFAQILFSSSPVPLWI